jgi:mannosidase alpha-like ER degradation enhancer 3
MLVLVLYAACLMLHAAAAADGVPPPHPTSLSVSAQKYAYPADELMPLSCKGRIRGKTKGRGDIDDALGKFSLTLVDTLDSLVVMGFPNEFLHGVQLVIAEVKFDENLVVSVFETNIRVLGGLLGAHAMMLDLHSQAKEGRSTAAWTRSPTLLRYRDELLEMAVDIGNRLMKAFDTQTGLPYTRINLRHGLDKKSRENTATCTACAGTLLLEFGALSRYTGDGRYERAARGAMEALWSRRAKPSNLVGETVNITTGAWLRTDASVGAGIDSYYEYLLKAWIMLDDPMYLDMFNEQYASIMAYIKQGPFLITTPMHRPGGLARKFMDSLQMFWPGLQVLKGDLAPAIQTHKMYYQLFERYGFFPEAYTMEMGIHWGNWPLRPEFTESTYFLYEATGDPWYQEVGLRILANIKKFTKVRCGFAAIIDVRKKNHEDKMDSFMLAETLKYLYLLFADKADVPIDLTDYVFTTEAHLLPVTLPAPSYRIVPFGPGNLDVGRKPATHDHSCPNPHRNQTAMDVVRKVFPGVWSEGQRNARCAKYTEESRVVPASTVGSVRGARGGKKVVAYIGADIAPEMLDVTNSEHVQFLESMHIMLRQQDGVVRLVYQKEEAPGSQVAQSKGLMYIQKLIQMQQAEQKESEKESRGEVHIQVTSGQGDSVTTFAAGPAAFGPNLDNEFRVHEGRLMIASPFDGCKTSKHFNKRQIVLVQRGGCMFIEKVRVFQKAGALAVIVMDDRVSSDAGQFTMSGDGVDDVVIPTAFVSEANGNALLRLALQENEPVTLSLSGLVWEEDEL